MSVKNSKQFSLKSWPWLEIALILSICSLALQILGPALYRWWWLPSSRSLGVDYLGEEFHNTCLSAAFVGYLPSSYHQQAAWPLVVYLHGSGGRGHNPENLFQIAQLLTGPNEVATQAVVLLPQCRPQCGWRPEDISQFVTDARCHYRIDPHRIYLIGNSMGGFGTWETAAAYPDLFAAIVPIAGRGNSENANVLANVPIWAFHGGRDEVVSPVGSTHMINAIRALGGFPRLTLYPELGHGIRDRVCRTPELWDWLFEQSLEHRQLRTID